MKYKQFLAMQREKGFALPAVNVTGSSTINGFETAANSHQLLFSFQMVEHNLTQEKDFQCR
jgi:fructose/tagatose bisphosphate aldolase